MKFDVVPRPNPTDPAQIAEVLKDPGFGTHFTDHTAVIDWTPVGAGAASAVSSCRRPPPWVYRPTLGIGEAVEVSSALTWSGVSVGRAASSRAAAPDVTAAACEVPEPRM